MENCAFENLWRRLKSVFVSNRPSNVGRNDQVSPALLYLLSRAESAYRNAAKNHKNDTAIRQGTKTAPGILYLSDFMTYPTHLLCNITCTRQVVRFGRLCVKVHYCNYDLRL